MTAAVCVFPCGGSGLKYENDIIKDLDESVFPCGGSGLKYNISRPAALLTCVFPCGGSGLKYQLAPVSEGLHPVSSPVGEVD